MIRSELADMIALAQRLASAQEPAVLATLFSSVGSTYRRLGSMMLSGPPGMMTGGVSGGCLEEYIARHGRSLIERQPAAMLSFDADPDADRAGKPVLGCGGSIEVLVERFTPAHRAFLREFAAAHEADVVSSAAVILEDSAASMRVRRVWFDAESVRRPSGNSPREDNLRSKVCRAIAVDPDAGSEVIRRAASCGENPDLSSPSEPALAKNSGVVKQRSIPHGVGASLDDDRGTFPINIDPRLQRLRQRALADRESRHGMLEPDRRALIHFIPPMTRLVILGAGNDVQPLSALARSLGWHVTVADRRARLASRSRFADADEVIAAGWPAAISQIAFTPNTAVVLMTHSLADDIEILPLIADKPMAYVGSLGPEHRRGWVLQGAAETSALSDDFVARFRGPIGLNLGDRSAAGIAVSIVAEILAEMNRRSPASLSAADSRTAEPSNLVGHA